MDIIFLYYVRAFTRAFFSGAKCAFGAAASRPALLSFLFVLAFFAAAPATPPGPRVPDWFEVTAGFEPELEIGAISNIVCGVKALVFDISGRIEFGLTDAVAPLSPVAPIHFSLKKGESASYKLPLHFVKESRGRPLSVNFVFDFPRDQLIAYAASLPIEAAEKEAFVARVRSASDRYEVGRRLDFIVTANESFGDLATGVYDEYLKNGFVVRPGFAPEGGIGSVEAEIRRYEEFISTVRNTPELKTYLATQMDLVAGEDRYLNYLYDAARYYYGAGDRDAAGRYFRRLLGPALKEARNVNTSEIYVDASMHYAVLLYDVSKKKEALELFGAVRDFCERRSDARLRYAYYNIANYHLLESNFAAAAVNFRKALALKPGFTACSAALKKIEGAGAAGE